MESWDRYDDWIMAAWVSAFQLLTRYYGFDDQISHDACQDSIVEITLKIPPDSFRGVDDFRKHVVRRAYWRAIDSLRKQERFPHLMQNLEVAVNPSSEHFQNHELVRFISDYARLVDEIAWRILCLNVIYGLSFHKISQCPELLDGKIRSWATIWRLYWRLVQHLRIRFPDFVDGLPRPRPPPPRRTKKKKRREDPRGQNQEEKE